MKTVMDDNTTKPSGPGTSHKKSEECVEFPRGTFVEVYMASLWLWCLHGASRILRVT